MAQDRSPALSQSIARRMSVRLAGVLIVVAGGAVVVALSAIRIRGSVGLDVRAVAESVARYAVAIRIRARAIALRASSGRGQRKARCEKHLLHSESLLTWLETTMESERVDAVVRTVPHLLVLGHSSPAIQRGRRPSAPRAGRGRDDDAGLEWVDQDAVGAGRAAAAPGSPCASSGAAPGDRRRRSPGHQSAELNLGTMLSGMQGVEIRHAVNTQDHSLAIDDELLAAVLQSRLSNPWEASGLVAAAMTDQPA